MLSPQSNQLTYRFYDLQINYIDPRSRRVLDTIIKLAATNMNRNVGKIKTNMYTKIGISLAKSDAQAGIAR